MKEIRASEIERHMRICEDGMSPMTVRKMRMHGDTVLLWATDGTETALDRDTVVDVETVKGELDEDD